MFATFTFRDPPAIPGRSAYTAVGHAGALRALNGYLMGLAEVYPGVSAFVAMEPHADRVSPHFHGLLGGLGPEVADALDRRHRAPTTGSYEAVHAKELIWQPWWDGHGFARLEKVDGNGVSLYVAKYSLKGGNEVPWWEVWEPGGLRNALVASRGRKRGR